MRTTDRTPADERAAARSAVCLLGPVAVLADGRPVEVGPARQRGVLAILLLCAGRPVTVDDLALRLWGEDPPPGCRESVRAYVCRLRRALLPTGVRIDRRAGGYAADLPKEDLDLHVFRALVVQARSAQLAGDARRAVAAYDQALGLWPGAALTGVGSEWLDARRDALALERHTVELDHADAALAVGEHARLLPSLVERDAAEPYDERLAGQLLLALHQCGRTTQALDHYRTVRQRLRTDLGTEPGAALRAVHQRVLAGEAAPVSPLPLAAAARAARPVVPHQLPPAPAGFVERPAVRAALDAAVRTGTEGPGLVVLSGAGGVGKTALAVHWARARAADFPDGELFLDLRGFDPDRDPVTVETALRALVLALGADVAALPLDLDALTGLYRSLARDRRLLVVADNARSAEQVRRLVPPGPRSVLLVTSRSRLTGLVGSHGAHPVLVPTMGEDAARRMLGSRLGPDRMAQDPAAVDALVDHCAGLPLALAIVAARAAVTPDLPLTALATELRQEGSRLDGLSAGESRTDVRATIASSVAVLAPVAAAVFALVGLVPGRGFDREEVAALASVPVEVATAAIGDLVAHHLAEDAGSGRFRMHDLVRLHAVGLAQVAADRAQAKRRLLELYRDAGPPQGDRRPAVFASVADAVEAGWDELACDLAALLVDLLGGRGCWPELVRVATASRDAAVRLGDRRRLTTALLALGRGLIGTGCYGPAATALAEARDLARELGDARLRAEACRASARWAARQGRHEEAIRHDRRGLLLHRRTGDRLGEAVALNAIAWHEAHLGRPAVALGLSRDALALLVALDAPTDTAATLDTVGYALDLLGRHEEARDHYRRSVALCAGLGHVVIGASVLERLAANLERTGHLVQARAARADAAAMLRSTGLLGPQRPAAAVAAAAVAVNG